ncbi:MAG: glycosyltransferase [Mariniphaga sp.]
MNIFQRYIDQQNDSNYNCLDQPLGTSSIFVVIPCYNEPDILTTLNSLAECYPPKSGISVLVVVNDAENTADDAIRQNLSTLESISQWQLEAQHVFFDVQRIYAPSLPQKFAGVGWARKIGMDAAIKQILNNNCSDGIIISLDADSKVLPNYLQTVENAFNNKPLLNFFTIHFEHPFDNPELSPLICEGIIRYELHMRYYRNAMKWIGYLHAIHTVGSSFALKASAYVKQGGMNRRKAGEDFYFLHKLVLLGDYGNISSTTVIPASRKSDRVPFGTGAAITKWMEGSEELQHTYSLEAFSQLRPLFTNPLFFWNLDSTEIPTVFEDLNSSLHSFWLRSGSAVELLEMRNNCSNAKIFEKRFYHLFNAFWILKFLNFVQETSIKRASLKTEALLLLQHMGIHTAYDISLKNLLEIFRNLDKETEVQ